MNYLENYLAQHACISRDKTAVICNGKSLSYLELYDSSRALAEKYKLSGQKESVIKTSQSIDFLQSYLASHLAGIPVVPLEKDIPDYRLDEVKHIVSENDYPDDIADILFTTGTTGKQKGVMISHQSIVANAENLVCAQGFDQSLAFIISGPLNHIGSLSKIWPMILIGGTIIITEGMKDTNSFFNAFDYSFDKYATFLVPASIRMLLRFEKERLINYAHKVDFIETGGAALMESDMWDLKGIFPHARLYNTYASTETGIIATHDFCHDGVIGGCLGHSMKNSELMINPNGMIACKGATIMSGYIGDQTLTDEVLKDGVIYTSDFGSFDNYGRLMLGGRIGEVINVGGYKVNPTDVESVVMSHPDIVDCICVGSTHPIMGSVLKLIYVVADGVDIEKRSLIDYLRNRLESYKLPFFYEQAQAVKRTYNGKIDRKFYKK